VKILYPPAFPGGYAVWGATGNDSAGRVFIGISSNGESSDLSGHLVELNPQTGSFTDKGDVLTELQRLRLQRNGETQLDLHSRIVEGADGRLYFSSMDNTGADWKASRMPTWGGHLWRLGPNDEWEHLKATPEALIAAASGGPYVYVLGYPGHVLFQFDTRSGSMRSIAVGSANGHVSRNFFVDDRGHAFVPRLSATPAPTAVLIELDAELKEVGAYPLSEYFEKDLYGSHGIVAMAPDGSHGWYFTTGKGRLYHQQPAAAGASTVSDLGWVHPAGPRYPASMYRDERGDALYFVAMPSNYGGVSFDWVMRHADGKTTVARFPYGSAPIFPGQTVVYGSITRDQAGRLYVVGMMDSKPVILQVTVPY
jgi:hypothetical protein